jgi:hypothetical protein
MFKFILFAGLISLSIAADATVVCVTAAAKKTAAGDDMANYVELQTGVTFVSGADGKFTVDFCFTSAAVNTGIYAAAGANWWGAGLIKKDEALTAQKIMVGGSACIGGVSQADAGASAALTVLGNAATCGVLNTLVDGTAALMFSDAASATATIGVTNAAPTFSDRTADNSSQFKWTVSFDPKAATSPVTDGSDWQIIIASGVATDAGVTLLVNAAARATLKSVTHLTKHASAKQYSGASYLVASAVAVIVAFTL